MQDWTLIALFVALIWLVTAGLALINAGMQGRSRVRWLFIGVVLGPIALIASLVPPKSSPAKTTRPAKRYSAEDLFGRNPPFSFEIRQLKKQGRLEEAAEMLAVLVDEAEAAARRTNRSVPPWPYQQLASVRRRQKNPAAERKILERYVAKAGPDDLSASLQKRLERLKEHS